MEAGSSPDPFLAKTQNKENFTMQLRTKRLPIFDIEELVIEKLRQMKHKGRISKYEALVTSAISLNTKGCDGFIMMEVESLIDTTLRGLGEEGLIAIYDTTEIRQEASEQNLELSCKESMIEDITNEIQRHIAEAVCPEANQRMPPKA